MVAGGDGVTGEKKLPILNINLKKLKMNIENKYNMKY